MDIFDDFGWNGNDDSTGGYGWGSNGGDSIGGFGWDKGIDTTVGFGWGK